MLYAIAFFVIITAIVLAVVLSGGSPFGTAAPTTMASTTSSASLFQKAKNALGGGAIAGIFLGVVAFIAIAWGAMWVYNNVFKGEAFGPVEQLKGDAAPTIGRGRRLYNFAGGQLSGAKRWVGRKLTRGESAAKRTAGAAAADI